MCLVIIIEVIVSLILFLIKFEYLIEMSRNNNEIKVIWIIINIMK